jgi:pyruvate/2-oxoglutarate dehydrogenase complex dihydrolipoamide dehydrogenase (E3) component
MAQFDMVVIGGGPAGVTAALRARELGVRTALVEREWLGGTCTNDGCVPTRVLAHAARLMRDAEQFEQYGLDAPRPKVDMQRALARVRQVIYQVHEKKQLIDHLDAVGVQTYDRLGPAHFIDPHHIMLGDGTTLESDTFIICAGGHPRRLDFPGSEHALTHSDAWSMTYTPESVVVVGGGATGCQFASIFRAFGASVTLMDVAPQILLTEDADVAAAVTDEFQQRGIDVIVGIEGLRRIDLDEGRFRCLTYAKDGEEHSIKADVVLMSVGWPGNIDSLRLDAAGVKTRGAYIDVNDALQTSAPHIYAAGDINGRMMLVQSASHQARIAVENAVLGPERTDERHLVPHGGFTDPEYGSVGLTEKQARDAGHDCVTALVPYADMDRAVIDGRTVGFGKLIVDRGTRQVLGAHVVGEQAVEVVHIVAAAMAGKLPIEELASLEIAYPTFAAVVGLAARQIARELDVVPMVAQWRALKAIRQRAAEWERSDSATAEY